MQFDTTKHRQHFENAISIHSRSERTRYNYLGKLDKFFREFPYQIPKATTAQLTEYISGCGGGSTIAQMHTTLNLFYKHVLKQPRKVAKFIPYPPKSDYFPNVPNHEQAMEMIEKTTNTKHRLILRILYSSGIRVSELVALKWSDVNREEGVNPLSLRITGKGGRFRLVPLSQQTLDELVNYCKEYNLKCGNKNHYIFGNMKPYSVRSVQHIVEEAGWICGFDNLSPHDLRRAFAREQEKHGIDLIKLQNLMGHKSISTTLKYTGTKNLEAKLLA